MTRTRTVLRNTLWSSLDLIVDFLLPPIVSILVARAMGPAKLGSYVYIVWISFMAATLGTFGLPTAALKFVADHAGKRQPEAVVAILRTSLTVQALVAGALTVAAEFWVWRFLDPGDRLFASIAVLAIFPGSLMGIASAMNSAMEDLGRNAIPSVAGGCTQTAVVVATLIMDWGLVGLAVSQVAWRTVDTGLRFFLMSRRLRKFLVSIGGAPGGTGRQKAPLPPGLGREMVRFCAQQSVLLLLTLIVWNRSEMYFLKQFRDVREVAFFSVAFGLSVVPAQLVGPFTNAAKASLFAEQGRDAEGGRRFMVVYWRYVALMVLPAALGLTVLSGPLVRVLYGAQYLGAVTVLQVAAAFSMLAPLGAPFLLLATAAGQQGLVVRCGLVAAFATLGLDLGLVLAWGAVGGALANGLGQAVSTVALGIFVGRRLGLRIPGGSLARITISAVGMATIVGAYTWLVPDLAAIIVGPALGAGAYALLLRVTRALDSEDADRLHSVGDALPANARPVFRKLVGVVVVR